jgi:ankyrin repeat protein
MYVNRQSIAQIILFFFVQLYPACILAQIDDQDEGIDKSEYISSSFPGALDYNLMIAASKGYISEIERLIEMGADVNATTEEWVTPLVFAVANNKTEAVKTLLKHNPRLDSYTANFETPLIIAVKNSNFEISELLLRAGADKDLYDQHGATALHFASIYGYTEIVDLLLYYDASVDLKSEEGSTPLLAAIWAGYTDVADLLIQNGATIEVKDYDGFTPFLMAAYSGDTIIMDILYKKGADIYATNNSNHNALTISILTGNKSVALFLLKIGFRWNSPPTPAVNPYEVASKYQRKEFIDILQQHNIQGKLKYKIDQVAITASSRFGLHDMYTGFNLSFKEPYLNGGFIAGCDIKLWYTRVLIKDSEQLFYQYQNKGSVAYAGVFKDFNLTDNFSKYNFSLSTALLAGYSFGNTLKGTSARPENKFLVIPSVSLKITKMNFGLQAGMEYMKTEFYHNGPLWFRLGFSYNYFFDKVRMKKKTINWY